MEVDLATVFFGMTLTFAILAAAVYALLHQIEKMSSRIDVLTLIVKSIEGKRKKENKELIQALAAHNGDAQVTIPFSLVMAALEAPPPAPGAEMARAQPEFIMQPVQQPQDAMSIIDIVEAELNMSGAQDRMNPDSTSREAFVREKAERLIRGDK